MGMHSTYVFSFWTILVKGLVAFTILKNDTLPKRGESLKISCLTSPVEFIGQLTNTWSYPSKISTPVCFADGYVCTGNTKNYSFTADNKGAYATIYGLDRLRDSGTWTCTLSDNLGTNSTVIVVYTSPKGVKYVQPIVSEADLGQESIDLICRTDNCTYPPPSMLWFYLNNQQQKVHYNVSDGVMVNNTTTCDQFEAIYTSTLHLTRGTTFQGNIPFKTKFVCGVQHPALDGVIQYSELSNYVNFAVNLTSVTLKDLNDNALPSTIELVQGSVVILKCVTSTSRPTATVRWYIGSTHVISGIENIAKPGDNGLEFMESNLTFTPNNNEHHNKYIYCQAYSSVNSRFLQSTQHTLLVKGDFAKGVAQGDVLMSWRTNLTDISNYRFVVNPSGANIISFNPNNVTGTAVPGFSNKVTDIGNVSLGTVSFRLLSLTVADAGRYYYKTLIGSADGGQILVIAGVPANISVMEVSDPLENEKYIMWCSAQSTSVPLGMGLIIHYQWKRENGQNITVSDRYYFSSDQSNLIINPLQRQDAGDFVCEAWEYVGVVSQSDPFSLKVIYGPDTNGLTLFPSNTSYQLTESSSFTVQCTATCVPQCNYQWIGPGISQNDNRGLLSVSEISRNQSGTFTCTVTNPRNPGKSVTANLSVIVYRALDVLVNYSGSMNSTVLLTCIASGEPSQYTFQEWIHKVGETEIRRVTGKNTANTSTLTLSNISIEDMGTYVCTVDIYITGQNGQIKQTGHTDIFVHGTLFTENTNSMFIGMINKSARIKIPFYSDPSSTTVKFYRGANTVEVTNTSDTLIFMSSFLNTFTFYGKEVLLNGQIAVLYFKMVKMTEFGEYTAVLFNDIGNTSRRIVFSLGKPEIPAKLYITDVQEKQVTLKWLSGDHKGFDQTFVIQISMDNFTWTNASLINAGKTEGWFSTTITGLQSNTLYYFRFILFNVNGASDVADINFATRTLKESASSLDIGASIGIGFGGIFIGVVGTISLMIIIWKRINATPNYSSSSEADMSTDMQTYANTGVSSSPAPTHYEQLQQDRMEKTMYDRI